AGGAIAAVELFGDKTQGLTTLAVTLTGALIGAVSLSGSLIAWGKLDGVLKKPMRMKGQQVVNRAGVLFALAVGPGLRFGTEGGVIPFITGAALIGLFFGCALLLGILI